MSSQERTWKTIGEAVALVEAMRAKLVEAQAKT